jgi:hypothetical protein
MRRGPAMSRLFLPVAITLMFLTCSALGAPQTVLYEHFTAVW